MRQRLCRVCMVWHDSDNWPMKCVSYPDVARSDALPVPNVISDTMPAIQHPLDQKFYTSKSTFERITREGGFETVGNDPARLRPPPKPKADRKAIRQSVERAVARFNRGERV